MGISKNDKNAYWRYHFRSSFFFLKKNPFILKRFQNVMTFLGPLPLSGKNLQATVLVLAHVLRDIKCFMKHLQGATCMGVRVGQPDLIHSLLFAWPLKNMEYFSEVLGLRFMRFIDIFQLTAKSIVWKPFICYLVISVY